jgi:hypothetical protein
VFDGLGLSTEPSDTSAGSISFRRGMNPHKSGVKQTGGCPHRPIVRLVQTFCKKGFKMFYESRDGQSLVVEDDETVVLTASKSDEIGFRVGALRPVTTAALLVAAGRTPLNPPRLSDENHFERLQSTSDFVSLAPSDAENGVDGYSISYLSHILDALDPNEPLPSHVEIAVAPKERNCGCSGGDKQKYISTRPIPVLDIRKEIASQGRDKATAAHHEDAFRYNRMYVPTLFQDFRVYAPCLEFKDIVVGFNSTLVLDDDVHFLIGGNFLGYQGSRIVQRGKYLNVDIQHRMQGSLYRLVHEITKAQLHIDLKLLSTLEPTKP